jgi:hypothetical protein
MMQLIKQYREHINLRTVATWKLVVSASFLFLSVITE